MWTTNVWDGMNIVAELDADGNVVNRWIRGFGLLRDMHGVWFIHNGLGDVAALMNQAGQVLRRYRYSAFGVEFDQDPADTNPWRYRGEYFDTETGMVYLRARFMNPRTGRFITADPYWGVHNMQACVLSMRQAGNLFVFGLNNPLMFRDPTGLYVVNFIDYLRAMGATVNHIDPNSAGQARVTVTYNGTTSNWILNSGYMDNRSINAHFGWSDFLTEADRAAGVGIVISGGRLYRNMTVPINNALSSTIAIAQGHRQQISNSMLFGVIHSPSSVIHMTRMLLWFYGQVNHGAAWDIKLASVWNQTIADGTFPGASVSVYFSGWFMTPEQLDNFTFGYIGRASGISQVALISGSIYAAPLGNLAQIRDEINDWTYVRRGFNHWRR